VTAIKQSRDALLASALAYAECTEDRTSKGDPALLGARLRICAKVYWRAVRSGVDGAARDVQVVIGTANPDAHVFVATNPDAVCSHCNQSWEQLFGVGGP
jgi:hypothetical protein